MARLTVEEADVIGFDVGGYVRDAAGPWSADPVISPLPADVAVAVSYVARSIGDTSAWLSQVLVTQTHKEARVTAFLSTWAYEQHWLAQALHATAPAVSGVRRPVSRWAAFTAAVFANVHGRALIGVQMAERFADSLLLDAMLIRLGQRADESTAELFGHARTVLARQREFFQETAYRELTAFSRTRRLTRRRLRRQVWPLGARREAPEVTTTVLRTTFATDTTWAHGLDAEVGQLPGLANLHLFRRLAG